MINNKYINIFKNKPLKSLSVPKVIVFDLDETLGSFAHLEILWNTLLLYNQNNILFNLCTRGCKIGTGTWRV